VFFSFLFVEDWNVNVMIGAAAAKLDGGLKDT
jgi:hypothetical protein